MLRLVGLAGFGPRNPTLLSGGEQQRVALARALAPRPAMLLLDEPLSALDKKLREEMQLELVRLQHEVGITFVLVTHDQQEALSMATEIAVMSQGRVLQIAPPRELYEQPTSRFVARFIGAINLFPARVVSGGNGHAVLEVDGIGRVELPHAADLVGKVALGVRPEKLRVSFGEPADITAQLRGRIAQIAYFGDFSHLFVETGGGYRITALIHNLRRVPDPAMVMGRPCWLSFDATDAVVLGD
jgi:ABC-type Fe3+/spermidine/putrescine transport system ATPase subunit